VLIKQVGREISCITYDKVNILGTINYRNEEQCCGSRSETYMFEQTVLLGHWINSYCIAKSHRQLSVESSARDSPAKCRQSAKFFLQSSKLRLPHPLTHRRVCFPSFDSGRDTHSLRERGGRSQFRRGDRHCGTLGTVPTYICTLC
jgi:hypothetical protein